MHRHPPHPMPTRAITLVLTSLAALACAGLAGCDSDQPTYKPGTTKSGSTKSSTTKAPAKWSSSEDISVERDRSTART